MDVEGATVLVAAVTNPPTIPCSSSSANLSKNDYHHPISSFNKIFSSVDMAMRA